MEDKIIENPSGVAAFAAQELICLDAEFAEGVEMLELSIVDASESVVYSRRFKPRTLTRWHSDIHGITPGMVADAPRFADCRGEIGEIMKNARYVAGFAVAENDLSHLRKEGLHSADHLKVLELRDWFWHVRGRDEGLDYRQGIGLEFCCKRLGIDTSEGTLHTSAFDATVTLRAFMTLLKDFVEANSLQGKSFDEVVEAFDASYAPAREAYDRECGRGYASIIRLSEGYIMKFTHGEPRMKDDVVARIFVEDRKKAVVDLSRYFLNRVVEGNFKFDRLSERKLNYFKSYTNSYSSDSHDFNNALMKLVGRLNGGNSRRR